MRDYNEQAEQSGFEPLPYRLCIELMEQPMSHIDMRRFMAAEIGVKLAYMPGRKIDEWVQTIRTDIAPYIERRYNVPLQLIYTKKRDLYGFACNVETLARYFAFRSRDFSTRSATLSYIATSGAAQSPKDRRARAYLKDHLQIVFLMSSYADDYLEQSQADIEGDSFSDAQLHEALVIVGLNDEEDEEVAA